MTRTLAFAAVALTLAACSGAPSKPTPAAGARVSPPSAGRPASRRSPYAPAREDPSKRGDYTRGGLYAPGVADSAPDGLPDVELIPEPEVRDEPRARYGNRSPYVVLGQRYEVLPSAAGYAETGIASYYGKKFHGRRTSNLEVYDMYAFSAAHKTLPLPSFARVTNLANGRSVIVRVNDRGPFRAGRIIDLSYAAAVKLGMERAGTARVQVRGLGAGKNADPDETTVAPVARDLADAAPAPVLAPRPLAATASGSAATYQVGSFAARSNAERALALLRAAGIGGARLIDADAGGRKLWRLRVGPVDAAVAAELLARIQGLGFGQPQRVRE